MPKGYGKFLKDFYVYVLIFLLFQEVQKRIP